MLEKSLKSLHSSEDNLTVLSHLLSWS